MPARTTKISLYRSISDVRHQPRHWTASSHVQQQQQQQQQQPVRGRSAAPAPYKSRSNGETTATSAVNGLLTSATQRHVDCVSDAASR